jgi:hypothetical protein
VLLGNETLGLATSLSNARREAQKHDSFSVLGDCRLLSLATVERGRLA